MGCPQLVAWVRSNINIYLVSETHRLKKKSHLAGMSQEGQDTKKKSLGKDFLK